jgi:nitroimidazol reductase NimA-like FMN-containing flavoprotein (pyridoxamine 5'-phosphate oxidase superfamily)
MPKNYNPEATPANAVLRKKYACDDEWISNYLQRETIGHIATRWDEQPFITPVLFWYDPERSEIIFHTNISGRLRTNVERFPQACFEACTGGRLLASNLASEFSYQYESVVAFGSIRVLESVQEKRAGLYGLLAKYFPEMMPDKEYRPILDDELASTCVYAFSISSWSGKRNWKEKAKQSAAWAPLAEHWLE